MQDAAKISFTIFRETVDLQYTTIKHTRCTYENVGELHA